MAPNFSHLLKKPAGEAKKPEALPAGTYPGVIQRYELGDNNKNKTPYVRFHVGLQGWPDDVSDADKEGHDLSKRNMRRDYYITDEALHRLDDLIKALGVEFSGRQYDEVLPELVGQSVAVDVGHYTNQSTGEIGNQINNMTAA